MQKKPNLGCTKVSKNEENPGKSEKNQKKTEKNPKMCENVKFYDFYGKTHQNYFFSRKIKIFASEKIFSPKISPADGKLNEPISSEKNISKLDLPGKFNF